MTDAEFIEKYQKAEELRTEAAIAAAIASRLAAAQSDASKARADAEDKYTRAVFELAQGYDPGDKSLHYSRYSECSRTLLHDGILVKWIAEIGTDGRCPMLKKQRVEVATLTTPN